MQPQDIDSAEQAAWDEFVVRLSAHLAAQWPALPERLGERYAAFVEHAVQQAEKRGLDTAAAVARYVNLCFIWGPSFQDRPGFEWALGLLASQRIGPWGILHQLVHRSLVELQRLPDARIDPATLLAADERLIDTFGHLGKRGALHPPEPPPRPRRPCDLEAAELRLLEPAVAEHYVHAGGEWQRVALPLPVPLRIDIANPAPRIVGVLSRAPGERPQARLQLRSRSLAICDDAVHPALRFAGPHGLWRWHGHETRAVSWPVATRAQPAPAAGPGSAIAEETTPEISMLELQVCGLRDEGEAIGSVATQVWVWPSAQWWLEVRRQAPAAAPVSGDGQGTPRGVTRCRLECDGQPHDVAPVREGFEQGLDAATQQALQNLLAAWTAVEGLKAARLEGQLALLVGQAAFTWGWQLGAQGLGGRAFMRLLGEVAMEACEAELQFEGELAVADSRSRIVLRCAAKAPLHQLLRREAAEPPLLPVMNPALARFSLPFEVEVLPLANDSATLLRAAGPCSGALVGEAGLRPRTTGGSGFEWFAALRLEPVNLPVEWIDPVLGRLGRHQVLLPAQELLNWRLG